MNAQEEIKMWKTAAEKWRKNYDIIAARVEAAERELGEYKRVCDGKTPAEMDRWFDAILANQERALRQIDDMLAALAAKGTK